MGPQHPSTHGVLRLVVRTDGEIVREAWPHIGFLHRCFEKVAESVTYAQVVPYTDRMDYLAAANNALAYCLGVEKLGAIEVPERAVWIRVIIGRAQPHRQPPGGLRHLRPGPGRVHAVPLRLPRARD